MNAIAINGSPRKKWNTAILLEQALDGAASNRAKTELIHLYDLDFKGCTSCFACKMKDGKSYGKCAMNDGLTPLLERLAGVDAIILGSPIYFGTVTGEIRSFMERFLFQSSVYTNPPSTLISRKIPTAFIYTMNVSEEIARQYQYPLHLDLNNNCLARHFGSCETLCCYETLQFEDYSKVASEYFDPKQREERRRTIFPEDCRKAFELGARLVSSPDTHKI